MFPKMLSDRILSCTFCIYVLMCARKSKINRVTVIQIKTHRPTDKKDRQANRQICRHREKKTNRKTYIWTDSLTTR
jgi:hypothetical protein